MSFATYTNTTDDEPVPELTYLPTEQESELVRLVGNRFREAEESRRPQDEKMLQCIAFVVDKQWHRWDWNMGRLVLPKAPPWAIREQINLIEPKLAQAVAALVSDLPQLDVEPMSNQPEDRAAAKIGKKFLGYLHERNRWERLYVSLARTVSMLGTGFIKSYWDPGALDFQAEPTSTITLDPETGQQVVQEGMRGLLGQLGQVGTALCSPFEIYPQPGNQEWDAVEWVVHAKVRSLEYIRSRYPEKGMWVGADAEGAPEGLIERRVDEILNSGNVVPISRREKSAVLLEYWEKPCTRYRLGRLITVCNGVVLRAHALPYEHLVRLRMLPFTPCTYNSYELAIWGTGIVEPLIPPQKLYNKTLSTLMGILNTTSIPKVMIPVMGRMTTTANPGKPGEVLRYHPGPRGEKPEYWHPSGPGREYFEMLQTIKADMDDIAQRHQVSAGHSPAGITAGVSIQLLQQSDDTAFGPKRTDFHNAIAIHGQHALALAKQFYHEPRLGQVTGEDDQRVLTAFSASDLPDYADVRAVASSKTPMSRAAKQQQLFDLYDRGVFGPVGSPPANITLLKRLEFGNVDDLAEEQIAYQVQQARQQHEMEMEKIAAQGQNALGLQQERGAQAVEQVDASAQAQMQRDAARGNQQAEMEVLRQSMQPAPPVQGMVQ